MEEDDTGGCRDAGLGAREGVGEVEVGLWLDGSVVGAEDGGEGFDVKEEVLVDFGDFGVPGGHDLRFWVK